MSGLRDLRSDRVRKAVFLSMVLAPAVLLGWLWAASHARVAFGAGVAAAQQQPQFPAQPGKAMPAVGQLFARTAAEWGAQVILPQQTWSAGAPFAVELGFTFKSDHDAFVQGLPTTSILYLSGAADVQTGAFTVWGQSASQDNSTYGANGILTGGSIKITFKPVAPALPDGTGRIIVITLTTTPPPHASSTNVWQVVKQAVQEKKP